MTCLRVQKCCCFPLSYGCVMLALIYMAWLIYELMYNIKGLGFVIHFLTIIQIIFGCIMLFTSLFMMFGTIRQKRLFMLPQIMGELIIVIFETLWTSLMIGYERERHVDRVLLLLTRLALIYVFSVFHCIIIWSRVEEIGELKGVHTKTEV